MKLIKKTSHVAASVYDDDREFEQSLLRRGIEDSFDKLKRAIEASSFHSEIRIFPIDCGFGKSTNGARHIGDMLRAGSLSKGALILVSRLSEIDAYIANAGLTADDFAVLSSDPSFNVKGLGSSRANEAPVLLSTQQMLRSKVKDNAFADCREFWFKGEPRTVKLWDETADAAEAISFSKDQITAIFLKLRSLERAFVTALEGLVDQCEKAPLNTVIPVPVALARMAAHVASARALFLEKPEKDTLKHIAALGGKNVVKCAFYKSWALAGFGHELPADIAPMVIMDASARLRNTYKFWADRAPIVRIMEPLALRYDDLTIHLWETGTGKVTLNDKARRAILLDHAAAAINRDPDEEWLVIGCKPGKGLDLESELRARLINPSKCSYVHWGDHHGTNKYAHIKKVLVLGPFIYPPADYRARLMAARGDVTGTVDISELALIEHGEIAHNLLQGICRSNLRNQDKGFAGEAEVCLMMAARYRPEAMLKEVFPSCTIRPWVPLKKGVKGQAGKVIHYLEGYFSDPAKASIGKADLRLAVGLKHRAELTRALKHKAVIAYLDDAGLENRYNDIIRASLSV